MLLMICLVFFFVLIEKEYQKYKKINRTTHECVNFINNFIISLSIHNTISATFEMIKESFSGELKKEVDSIEHLNIVEKLEYLSAYFNSSLYDFFLKIIHQYEYNGGDIIGISQILIFDSRNVETSIDNFISVSKRKFIEFIILWGITMAILLILQFALSMFYDTILNMSFYAPSIFIFFIMFLIFLYFFLKHNFNLSFINEWREKDNEKPQTKN